MTKYKKQRQNIAICMSKSKCNINTILPVEKVLFSNSSDEGLTHRKCLEMVYMLSKYYID